MKSVLGTIAAALTFASLWAQSDVNWSILPNVRTGAPNEDLTFFATIVNGADVEMTCQPRFGGAFARPGGVTGQARFFTFDGTDVSAGFNQPVAIPAGGEQDYVVSLSANRAYTGEIIIPIGCTDPQNAEIDLPRLPLVNDFQVIIESGNPPDIIMVSDTLSRDGVARVGETGPRAALMTVAAVNIGGDAENVRVFPGLTGFSALNDGFAPTICEINAAGICHDEEARFAQIALWEESEIRTFAIRARIPPELAVPFYPERLRMDLGVTRDDVDFYTPLRSYLGRTGVAIDAERHTTAAAGPAPVQQCIYDQTGDAGGSFSREGGILAIAGTTSANPEPGTVFGYFRQSDNQFESRYIDLTPFSFTMPAGDNGPATMDVFGAGPGTVQTDDATANIQVSTAPDGSLQISWLPNAGFSNDFEVRGRIRCAPAPELPDSPEGDIEASTSGTFIVEQTLIAGGGDDPAGETVFMDPEAGDDAIMGIDADPAENVANGFMIAMFAYRLQRINPPDERIAHPSARPDDPVVGVFVPTQFGPAGNDSVVNCAIVMASGHPDTDEANAGRNANIFLIRRQGVEFGDVQADCVR